MVQKLVMYKPNPVAEITICGCITLVITDQDKSFIRPSPEQIRNLHDMLCIDVKLFDDSNDLIDSIDLDKDIIPSIHQTCNAFNFDACRTCSCNPSNGGSGNCNCTLASPNITSSSL